MEIHILLIIADALNPLRDKRNQRHRENISDPHTPSRLKIYSLPDDVDYRSDPKIIHINHNDIIEIIDTYEQARILLVEQPVP